MPNTLPVEKASFTDNSVDCLYFSSSMGKSEYFLVKYKDPKKLFRKKIRYEQSHIRQFTILSEKKHKIFFITKKNHKICLVEFNDDNKIVIRVKEKLYKKLQSGILEKRILDNKITRDFVQDEIERERSNDISKRLEKIYGMWKEGILTKYEFKVAKKKMLNY